MNYWDGNINFFFNVLTKKVRDFTDSEPGVCPWPEAYSLPRSRLCMACLRADARDRRVLGRTDEI